MFKGLELKKEYDIVEKWKKRRVREEEEGKAHKEERVEQHEMKRV